MAREKNARSVEGGLYNKIMAIFYVLNLDRLHRKLFLCLAQVRVFCMTFVLILIVSSTPPPCLVLSVEC